MTKNRKAILAKLDELTPQELKRYLAYELTEKRLGLHWESDLIERDQALNADLVFPVVDAQASHWPDEDASNNLIIEGDNFDSLRLLRSTHRGKIRVIYIDPPYNTGNKDWVYNDHFIKKEDRWKHSTWLEFMCQRLTLARDLLTPDGVILISINDENRSRLELLMDEVMPGQRAGSFVWRTRTGGNDAKGYFISDNHEHVLVYAKSEFQFTGDEKGYSIYTREENGRVYYLGDLAKAHNRHERPNTYYKLTDPATGISYPCNPNRVWAYATESRVTAGTKLRGSTIEKMIADGDIWFPEEQRVEVFHNVGSLKAAISSGDVPFSGKAPLLWDAMPDIKEWVGVKIGYGRPRLKKFKDHLKNERSPISSWLTPRSEKDTAVYDNNMPVVSGTSEGTGELRKILNSDDSSFPYPKPPSVIKALLAQASHDHDIILDFFAGSGTTGHAVMELNAADGGNRQFILCSSTEATHKEPEKNLCRDVCAERMRRVMAGYGDTKGLGGSFTYLTMDRVEDADLMFEGTASHAFALLCLRETGYLTEPPADQPIWVVAQSGSSAIVVCQTTDQAAQDALKALPHDHLVLYSTRPESVAEALENHKAVTCYAIQDALRFAQAGDQATRSAVHEATNDAITTTTEGV